MVVDAEGAEVRPIDGQLCALGSPEQGADWHTKGFANDVEQGVFNGSDGLGIV